MQTESLQLREECPECYYDPQPNGRVQTWEVDTEIGIFHAVECPECGNCYIFAIETELSRLPPIEKLLQWMDEAGM